MISDAWWVTEFLPQSVGNPAEVSPLLKPYDVIEPQFTLTSSCDKNHRVVVVYKP